MTDLLHQAATDFAAGRFGAAEALALELLDTQPTNGAALRLVARARLARHDLDAAAEVMHRIADPGAKEVWLHVALGMVARTGRPDTAIGHFRAAIAGGETRPETRRALADCLQATGRNEEARALLEALAAERPVQAASLVALGRCLIRLRDTEAGLDRLAEAVACDPAAAWVAAGFGQSALELGRADLLVERLAPVTARHPGHAHLHLALGQGLVMTNRLPEARDHFAAATGLAPGEPAGWIGLAETRQMLGDGDVVDCYRRAAALRPDLREVHGRLAGLLHGTAEARPHLLLSFPWAHAAAPPAAGPRLRVGVLSAAGQANISVRFLIDRQAAAWQEISLIAGYQYPVDWMNAAYDVIFNAVGDADLAGPALRQADDLAARLRVPVMNPPAAVLRTTRDRIAARLAGSPGAVVPLTSRLRRPELLALPPGELPPGFEFPVLLRAAGRHGGADIALARDDAELRASLTAGGGEALYMTQFVDCRSADGGHRKYRVVFLGGEALPYHLSVTQGWLNHYFRAEMTPGDRDEEAAFLADPARLGPQVMTALAEFGRRMHDLDYCGVDFSVDRQGRLVLFECNGSMLVDQPQQAIHAYRQPHAMRIRDAFSRRLRERATQPGPG